MTNPARFDKFLEPIYVNEKMVLNCAAYLFKGVPFQTETTESSDRSRGIGLSVGIPFLGDLLGAPKLQGGASSSSLLENRSARRYTVGGLHMAVLDELHERKMIHSDSADRMSPQLGIGEAYVDIEAVLRTSDYFALIGTLKILGPLVSQIFRDYGDKLFPMGLLGSTNPQELRTSVDIYEESVLSLLDKLERDYLTSKQLEMILWSGGEHGRPVGIVDLDVSDYEPNELRSKLSGGKYHVIGKVISTVGRGQSIDLLQKTILSNTIDLIQKLMNSQQDQQAIRKARQQIGPIKQLVEQFLRLEIPGPAVRVAAMSVCI
ncbi:MAG: hypothetical protein ACJ789_03960 [Thermomicrobiales bacterium]